jgi:hypothetical protein
MTQRSGGTDTGGSPHHTAISDYEMVDKLGSHTLRAQVAIETQSSSDLTCSMREN